MVLEPFLALESAFFWVFFFFFLEIFLEDSVLIEVSFDSLESLVLDEQAVKDRSMIVIAETLTSCPTKLRDNMIVPPLYFWNL